MSLRICRVPRVRATALGVLLAASCLFASREARGQFVQQQVGGVSIDAHGVVSSVRIDALNELKRERQKALEPVTGDLKPLALRKISLRQLEAAIAEHRQNGTAIGDDIRFLAGLQRIQYVFVYPERNDVVLAGPAEGWKLNGQGELVGLTTNRPVMLLDDLLVALRSLKADRPTGISCSIDPTSEGIARLQTLLKNAPTLDGNPDPFLDNLEQTLGPQTITVAGVADTTHFANVLVAADYRMKRLAMAFEPAPIAGLPDFLHMLKSSSSRAGRQMLPRWWLAPAYDAILADADG